MTDPTTPTPLGSAKSARETIAEAVNVMAAATAWNWSNRTLEEVASAGFVSEPRPSELRLHAHAEAKAALALRALLDAQPGGVEALCEAVEETAKASDCAIGVLHDLDAKGGLGHDRHRQIQRVAEALSTARGALCNTLAALRASPESVGGAAPSGRAAQAINTAGRIVREAEAERDNAQRTASSLSVELAVAAKERDALKADLAAARGEVIAEREARNRCANAGEEERVQLRADLAAARGEVERVRVPRVDGASLPANECINNTHGLRCEGRGVRDWYVDGVLQACCSACGVRSATSPPASEAVASAVGGEASMLRDKLRAAEKDRDDLFRTAARAQEERDAALALVESVRAVHEENVKARMAPPPASEAPISERARLVYEGAVKFAAADPCAEEDSTPYVLGKHDRRAEFIAKYVEVAAEILAAAERTVKAPQAEG